MSNFSSQLRLSSSLIKRFKLRFAAATETVERRRAFTTSEGSRPTIVHKRSVDILHDPWFNKGTAFSMTERDRLDLRGLLPSNVMTEEQQIQRFRGNCTVCEQQHVEATLSHPSLLEGMKCLVF